jgi:hypothetical protein
LTIIACTNYSFASLSLLTTGYWMDSWNAWSLNATSPTLNFGTLPVLLPLLAAGDRALVTQRSISTSSWGKVIQNDVFFTSYHLTYRPKSVKEKTFRKASPSIT